MFDINIVQDSLANSFTILASVLGGLITGFFSWLATKEAYKHNKLLKDEELKLYEKATALSIIEELKVLKEAYEDDMDKYYNELKENKYLDSTYTITQDFMTVYSQNAGEIGLIKNVELRNLIIKSYTLLKKYIEHLVNYQELLEDFMNNRKKFIGRIYADIINTECTKADCCFEVNNIRKYSHINNWDWLNEKLMSKSQVINFLNSDDKNEKELIYFSEYLKTMYYELKDVINKTFKAGNEFYGE